jgi:hypothetical protein
MRRSFALPLAAPAVAVDPGGDTAVGFAHIVGRDCRVEVRRGTTGTLLRGPSTLVASAAGRFDRVALAWAPDPRRLAVAWSRFGEVARVFGRRSTRSAPSGRRRT